MKKKGLILFPIRTSVVSTCATTMQLAWLDLWTRDTSVCVHLVTRETTVKKVRVTLHVRSNNHVNYYNYASLLHPFYHGLVCFHMCSNGLQVIYYPTVLLRVQKTLKVFSHCASDELDSGYKQKNGEHFKLFF